MNKKSFWRGFGAGVLFASIILGISCLVRTSDTQVVSRAKKLGMVYEKDAENAKVADGTDATNAPTEETKEKATTTPKATKEPKATESVAAPTPEKEDQDTKATTKPETGTKKDSDTSLEEEKQNMEQEKKKMQQEIKDSTKNLEIKAGDWSSTVSSRLESLGIIDDATDFDKYLNDNGYSNSINAGTYQVSPDDTYAELAKKITGK